MPDPREQAAAVANDQQSTAWNGWEGAHWARHSDRYNAMVGGGFNEILFEAAAIDAGECVLDVGCGTGETAIIAARHAIPGRVIGIDLSAVMLERAGHDAVDQRLPNVTFVHGDAQVHPFPAKSIDVVISRAGLHLFRDPAAAFTNLRGALRAEGRLVFLSPQPPDPDSDQARATAALRPYWRTNSPSQQGMESLADPTRLREVLTASGFGEVTITSVHASVRLGDNAGDAADFLLSTGPIRVNLDGLAPDELHRLHAAVRDGFTPFDTPRGVYVRRKNWLITAKPTNTG